MQSRQPACIHILLTFIWDSLKGKTFGSHHIGNVGTEVRNFFDYYTPMQTAISTSAVSQVMFTQYHETAKVATEALSSNITANEVTVACKQPNNEDNKEQRLVIYKEDIYHKIDNDKKIVGNN